MAEGIFILVFSVLMVVLMPLQLWLTIARSRRRAYVEMAPQPAWASWFGGCWSVILTLGGVVGIFAGITHIRYSNHFDRARAASKRQDRAAAIAEYRLAIATDGGHAASHFNLAFN